MFAREAIIEDAKEESDICDKEETLHSDVAREPVVHAITVETWWRQPENQKYAYRGVIAFKRQQL